MARGFNRVRAVAGAHIEHTATTQRPSHFEDDTLLDALGDCPKRRSPPTSVRGSERSGRRHGLALESLGQVSPEVFSLFEAD